MEPETACNSSVHTSHLPLAHPASLRLRVPPGGGEGDLVVVAGVVLVLDGLDAAAAAAARAALVPVLPAVLAAVLPRAARRRRVLFLVPVRRLRRSARQRLQHVRHGRRRLLLLLGLGIVLQAKSCPF